MARRPRPVYSRYWPMFSRYIREVRAQNVCECSGECGLHRTHPGPRRCVEVNHAPAQWAQGMVVLTVAHLCTCDPPCILVSHVKSMCQRCHLLVDLQLHLRHAAESRRAEKEALGQLSFLATDVRWQKRWEGSVHA
jgi:hypothetical protein